MHFLFGEDIPRRLQFDGSLDTAVDVLQTLLDRRKISKDDCGDLFHGLRAIEREVCAQRLLDKILKIIEYNIYETMLALDYRRLVSAEIMLIPSVELQQDQNSTTTELSRNTSSKVPTVLEMLAGLEEDDSMSLPRELII